MPKLTRRDLLKLGSVGVPLVGLGTYELVRRATDVVDLPAPIPSPAMAEAATPYRVIKHAHRPSRNRPFPGTRVTAMGTPPFDLMDFQPEVVKSENGVLDVILDYRYASPVVNGRILNIRTYDGVLPGRTFVASPGDYVRITNTNNFPPTAADDPIRGDHDINEPHGFNVVNLHTHGFHISPALNADNVLVNIHPGETFVNEYYIPKDHPTGSYWYHPHKHGSAGTHFISGMAGLFVIEGRGDLLEIPEIAAAKEVHLITSEMFINQNNEVNDDPEEGIFDGSVFFQLVVNGLAINEGIDPATGTGGTPPFLRMQPGEVQHWRFVQGNIAQTFNVALQGHQLHIAARDAITQDELETVDEVIIAPGNRMDFLIKASDTPGTYAFESLPLDLGEGFVTPLETLFNVIVEGDPMNMALPSKLNPPRKQLPPIHENEIVRQRRVEFQIEGEIVVDPSGNVVDQREFFVNGRKFSPHRVDHIMELGTAEEWTIASDAAARHPFHIHQNEFHVMEIRHADGTVEVPNNGIGRIQDTIDVPAGGEVVVRHRFEDFAGTFVFHCHIILHEDVGMMSLVEIVDTAPISTRVSSKNGGTLVSRDFDSRITIKFPPRAFGQNSEVLLTSLVEAPYPTGELIGLQRYFELQGQRELERVAGVEVKFALAVPEGVYDPETVRLYRWNGSAWSTEGINFVALTTERLISTILEFGEYAVLAEHLVE